MPSWLMGLLTGPNSLIATIASFIPNPEERAKAQEAIQAQILNAAITEQQQQTDIDKAEAQSASLFVAGWRPMVGWLCCAALGWQFFLAPIATYVLTVTHAAPITPLPMLSDPTMTNLLYALLGIGGLRSVEKFGGVSTTAISGLIRKAKGASK